MAQRETCGNDYDTAFVIKVVVGSEHTFDSFECAIQHLRSSMQALRHGNHRSWR